MILIMLDDHGNFKVIDPETKEDITKKGGYECNAFTIQTDDGRYKSGFHIGTDCTEEIETAETKAREQALGAAEDHVDPDGVLGDASVVGAPKTGGRYNRGG